MNTKNKNPIIDSTMTIFEAIVMNIMNKQVQVQTNSKTLLCPIPGSFCAGRQELCLGDLVEVAQLANDQYKLLHILPRKTAIYRGNRRAPGEKILIAANADVLLAIVTASYFLNQAGYLESAMIAAKRASVEMSIFVSKLDCIMEGAKDLLRSKLELYKPLVMVAVRLEKVEEAELALSVSVA